jgi:opacity protein-like surface antigen
MTKNWTGFGLTASAVGAILSFGPALAADMPVKALVPVPAFIDWSGVYIGVHAGYGGGMKDYSSQADFVARGFLGGGQVGINKQISSFVFGLELDGSWADIKGSQSISIGGPILGLQANLTAASKIDSLVTFAGRAGLAADRWFVFAKAGIAVAHEEHSLVINQSIIPAVPGGTQSVTVSGSENRVLPMLGFGAEYALDGNWSIKGEYDYFYAGSRNVRFAGSQTLGAITTPVTADLQIEQALHVVKLGVNYRFGRIALDPAYAPVRAAPGYDWTGAYIGVQGGYGFGQQRWPDIADPLNPGRGKYDADGWLAGGTGGVNVQSGVFVFGVEGEWMWTGIKGGQTFTDAFGGVSQTTTLETSIDWLAIASARAGFVVGDKLLLYGKGGLAIAEEKHSVTLAQTVTGIGSTVIALNAKPVHTGVVAGAGAEYALGGNWSAKIEYDYIRMFGQEFTGTGIETVNVPPTVGQIDFQQKFNKMSQDMHLIKFGVNYHFNPMPVVVSARY